MTPMRRCVVTALWMAAVLGSGLLAGTVRAAEVVSPSGELTDRQREQVLERLGLRDFRVERLEMVKDGRGEVRVQVGDPTAADDGGAAPVTMVLNRYSLLTPGFQVLVPWGQDGELVAFPDPIEVTTFRGWVAEDACRPEDEGGARAVVASIVDGGLTAAVYAPVQSGVPGERALWTVEPLRSVFPQADAALHVIYQRSDERAGEWLCGTDHGHCGHSGCGVVGPDDAGPGLRGPFDCDRIAEIMFDADWEYYQLFSTTPDSPAAIQSVTADIQSIVNQCDFIYARDARIRWTIPTLIVRSNSADPYSSVTDAGAFIGEVAGYWSSRPQPFRDVLHVFTGRDFNGGTIGVAYVGAMCNINIGVGISQSRYGGSFGQRVIVTAHEVGHNFNCPHDSESGCSSTPNGFIMWPSVGNENNQTFSDCSKSVINAYKINASCVAIGDPQPPVCNTDTPTVPRGQSSVIDVLANDISNCSTMTLTLPSTTSAAGGTLAVSPTGGAGGRNAIVYTPPAGGGGPTSDTFTYTATHLALQSSTGTVNVGFITALPPVNARASDPGLSARYFALTSPTVLPNFEALSPYLTTTVTQVNFPSTSGNFANSTRSNNVGAVYEGLVAVPTAGTYTFFTESDDGSRLLIAGQQVLSNDGLHGMQERSGDILLEAGKHPIRIEFFEASGGAGLIARYQGPGLTKQVIPASALSRQRTCLTDVDRNGLVDADDIFGYLNIWFGTIGPCPAQPADCFADVTGDRIVDSDDIFAFLTDWFATLGACN